MAYISRNPVFKSTILKNSSLGTEPNPVGTNYKLIVVDGTLYVKDSAGNETPVGSSSGVFNYISNPRAAQNATDGVTENVTSGSFTVAQTTTEAELPGTDETAFLISGSGVTANDNVALAISQNIALADGSTIGTSEIKTVDVNGTLASDWTAQLYNVTQSRYVGSQIQFQGTGTYPLDAPLVADEDYELRLIAKVANPAAASFEFGLFAGSLRPGALIGDLEPISVTLSPGFGSSTSRFNKVIKGSELLISGQGQSGTTAGSVAYFELDNEVIDVTGLVQIGGSGTQYLIPGEAYRLFNGGGGDDNASGYHVKLFVDTSLSSSRIYVTNTSTNANNFGTMNVNAWLAGADGFYMSARVPVQSLAQASTPLLSDVAQDNIYFEYDETDNPSVANLAYQLVKFQNTVEDASSLYDTVAGTFTVPTTGKYSFNIKLTWVNSSISGLVGLVIKKNDQTSTFTGAISSVFYNNRQYMQMDDTLLLEAGDVISFHAYQSSGSAESIQAGSGANNTFNRLSVQRVSEYSARAAGLPISDTANEDIQYLAMRNQRGTWSPSQVSTINMTGTASFVNPRYEVIGNKVFVEIDAITGVTTSSLGANTVLQITSTGLPGVTNSTIISGSVYWFEGTGNRVLAASVLSASGGNTDIAFQADSQNSGGGVGGTSIQGIRLEYTLGT